MLNTSSHVRGVEDKHMPGAVPFITVPAENIVNFQSQLDTTLLGRAAQDSGQGANSQGWVARNFLPKTDTANLTTATGTAAGAGDNPMKFGVSTAHGQSYGDTWYGSLKVASSAAAGAAYQSAIYGKLPDDLYFGFYAFGDLLIQRTTPSITGMKVEGPSRTADLNLWDEANAFAAHNLPPHVLLQDGMLVFRQNRPAKVSIATYQPQGTVLDFIAFGRTVDPLGDTISPGSIL